MPILFSKRAIIAINNLLSLDFVFIRNFSSKIARKLSVYKALSYFCVIITRALILRTIPVAFIYKNSFVDLITLLLSVNIGVLYFSQLCLYFKMKFIFVRNTHFRRAYARNAYPTVLAAWF